VRVPDALSPREKQINGEGTTFEIRRRTGAPTVTLTTPLIGRHQVLNAATAIAMLDAAGPDFAINDAELAAALSRVTLPGRFQRVDRYVFDVAHNPDGAAVLAATIRTVNARRPVSALVTVLADKDWAGMLRALAPVVDHFVLSIAPTAPASRLWNPDAALRAAHAAGWSAEVVIDFDAAVDRAKATGATVLITGSFHTVGDAMVRLQVDPLAG
jgi:dihydrofolate synthase/folylpolyglutamate synthase